MESIAHQLSEKLKPFIEQTFSSSIPQFEFQATRKEFDGDITLVVFSLLRYLKGNPVQIATQIGDYLKENFELVTNYNVVKGFLNLSIQDSYYVHSLNAITATANYGHQPTDPASVYLVEYSSPNTNKPLHLGHIRNNLLGYAIAKILEASGKKVIKTQIINDRGIHICKSMLAWKKFGSGETPESSGLKGDKLVGNYYVRFDKEYKKEIQQLIAAGQTEDEAKVNAPLFVEAQKMLRDWEAGGS